MRRNRVVLGGVLAVLVASVLLGGFTGRAGGPTIVCGDLTGTVAWTPAGNPFYVTCDVTLVAGASLSVQAGVTVLVSVGSHFYVDGALFVAGTAGTPVVFDSNATTPAPNDWGGLDLGSATYAQLTGLVVRHANVAVRLGISPTGQNAPVRDSEFAFSEYGIMVVGATGTAGAFLQHVSVHDDGAGIFANSTLYVADSSVAANRLSGIRAGVGPLYLTNTSVIRNNATGIELLAMGQPAPYSRSALSCNAIADNGLGVGILATDPSSALANVATVFRNNFVNNTVQARDTSASAWDNGTAGNFWSDYNGTDANGDGFGDTPYVIDADSVDHHPFIAPVRGCPGGGGPVNRPPGAATPLDAQLTGVRRRDVTLTWGPSPDDGAGGKDVAAYLLYSSTAFDPRGTGYSLLATLPAGTTSYMDARAGVGDPSSHFYRLVTRDTANQTTASPDQFTKYARALTPGPHLLSIPVRLSNTSVDAVLGAVDYSIARTYANPAGQDKNWLSRVKTHQWGSLTNVDETEAIWLMVNTNSELDLAGLVKASITIHLDVGWNFVGYPSFVDRTVAGALADVRVQTVEGFDAANSPFYLRRLVGTDVLHAGDGIWVHVSAPFDWTLTN